VNHIVTGKVIREVWVIAYPNGGQSVVFHSTEESARDTPAVRQGQGTPVKVYVVVPLDETPASPPWPPSPRPSALDLRSATAGKPARLVDAADLVSGASYSACAGLASWAVQRPKELHNFREEDDAMDAGYANSSGARGIVGIKRWFKENF
jgi:hypothetical protein